MSNAYGFDQQPVNPGANGVNATKRQSDTQEIERIKDEIRLLRKDVDDLKKAVDSMLVDVYRQK